MVSTSPARPAHASRASAAGLAVTATLFVASALPAVPALAIVTALDPAPEYPPLALVLICAVFGGSAYLAGALAMAWTLGDGQRRLARRLLLGAALPWLVVAVGSLPFLAQVCTRRGGACF